MKKLIRNIIKIYVSNLNVIVLVCDFYVDNLKLDIFVKYMLKEFNLWYL